MSDLRNIQLRHDSLLRALGTRCFSKPGLAEGTNAATIKTAAPNGAGTDYSIAGVMYHKADTDNIALTAAAAQAADTTCYYLIQIDSAGTVSSVKGTTGGNVPQTSSAAVCPIGILKVVTVAVTFTAGTTDLSAAGVTATFTDITLITNSNP